MGFRLGGSCSPCCGGSTPPSGDCLSGCRPAGETREIASIEIVVEAFDYLVEWQCFDNYNSQTFTQRYYFPGTKYSGTYSLTKVATGFYRYAGTCDGECSGSVEFSIAPREGTGTCVITPQLVALFTPEANPPRGDESHFPTCKNSWKCITEQNYPGRPAGAHVFCGTSGGYLGDARYVPASREIHSNGYYRNLPVRSITQAAQEAYRQADANLENALALKILCASTPSTATANIVAGARGTSKNQGRAVVPGTIVETGNPVYSLRSVSVTYA